MVVFQNWPSLIEVSGQVLGGILVTVEDVEVVSVDLNVSTNWHVCWSDELHLLVHVLVLLFLQEWAFEDTRILLSWLED